MKKVHDKALERKIDKIIKGGGKGRAIVSTLKELQDAGGLKVCQNVPKTDAAYRSMSLKERW